MPKIALRYVGNDEKMKARLEQTGGVSFHEPVDAQEILATPGQKDYEIVDEQRQFFGQQYDAERSGGGQQKPSVPTLQGADNEMQTGLSQEVYRRDQVVKAVPDGNLPTAARPMTTTGRPLDLEAAQSGQYAGSGDPRFGMQQERPDPEDQPQGNSGSGGKPASDGMTVDEMKDHLRKQNVAFPSDAKKAELAELVDRHATRR